jgi:lipocalin
MILHKIHGKYRLLESGEVALRNACVTAIEGLMSIDRVAIVVDQEHRAKLNVISISGRSDF